MGLQVLLTVGSQAVQTRLDSLELFPRAEVTGHVGWAGKAVSWGRVDLVKACLLDLFSHLSQHGVGPQHRPLGEGDLALRADVDSRVVSLVPVATDAVHTEAVATRNSHGVL